MKLKELYNRDIERKVNPAVSASDFDEETVHTEIEEYVFTDEIILLNESVTTILFITYPAFHYTTRFYRQSTKAIPYADVKQLICFIQNNLKINVKNAVTSYKCNSPIIICNVIIFSKYKIIGIFSADNRH